MRELRVRRLFALWLPVGLYVAMIFWISSAMRPLPGMQYIPRIDKLYHFLEYAPLGWLLARALRGSSPKLSWALAAWGAVALAACVAGSDEFYQSFVPGKVSSLWDGLADAAGSAFGCAYFFSKRARTP